MAARKKTTTKKKVGEKNNKTCGQCKNCTFVTEFHTMSLLGKPTLGTCPHWTTSRCVILSMDTCDRFELSPELSATTETNVDSKESVKAKLQEISRYGRSQKK